MQRKVLRANDWYATIYKELGFGWVAYNYVQWLGLLGARKLKRLRCGGYRWFGCLQRLGLKSVFATGFSCVGFDADALLSSRFHTTLSCSLVAPLSLRSQSQPASWWWWSWWWSGVGNHSDITTGFQIFFQPGTQISFQPGTQICFQASFHSSLSVQICFLPGFQYCFHASFHSSFFSGTQICFLAGFQIFFQCDFQTTFFFHRSWLVYSQPSWSLPKNFSPGMPTYDG